MKRRYLHVHARDHVAAVAIDEKVRATIGERNRAIITLASLLLLEAIDAS